MRRPFQSRAAGERVGMALDKLPDPLPPRHWEQWGGRAICRPWDAHIGLRPFLSDEVKPRSSGQPRARRPVGPCVRSCRQPGHSAAPQPSNHSDGKTIQRQSYQQCHTESCPRPPLSLAGLQYQFVVLPVMFSDQPELEAALVARQVLFACFLIFMSQNLDPRQDYRGK